MGHLLELMPCQVPGPSFKPWHHINIIDSSRRNSRIWPDCNQNKDPSTLEWMNDLWFSHAMGYHTAVKIKSQVHLTTGM